MWDIIGGNAASAMLGGGADFLASRYLQRDSQRFNAAESRAQRAWSERMSNTQYQRAADDLEKAGLNRILALGSPAGVPHGATASSSATSVGKTFSDIPKIGIAAATAKQSIEQSKAETHLKNVQAQNEESLRPAQEELFLQQAANQREQASYWSAKSARIGALEPAYNFAGQTVQGVFGQGDPKTGSKSFLDWLVTEAPRNALDAFGNWMKRKQLETDQATAKREGISVEEVVKRRVDAGRKKSGGGR